MTNEERAVLKETLRAHWLFEIKCDARTDVAVCACGVWSSAEQPTVGYAVDRWIEHVLAMCMPGG